MLNFASVHPISPTTDPIPPSAEHFIEAKTPSCKFQFGQGCLWHLDWKSNGNAKCVCVNLITRAGNLDDPTQLEIFYRILSECTLTDW